ASADWLEARFKALGLAPGGSDGGFRLDFPVTVEIVSGKGTRLAIDGGALPEEAIRPLAFSTSAAAAGETVAAGYGITAPEQHADDYAGLDANGKIVVVRRFVPAAVSAQGEEVERKLSDLRYKAWNAREHGAIALVVVDLPLPVAVAPSDQLRGEAPAAAPAALPAEAPLPALAVSDAGDAGIPVLTVRRAEGSALFSGAHRADLAVELSTRSEPARDVVAVVRAGAPERYPGAVLVGAHYDHLGFGGFGSLDPDSKAPHNGADDNASGTAALLEAARTLAAERGDLRRDVWLVAFSGEERGVLGSTAFTRNP